MDFKKSDNNQSFSKMSEPFMARIQALFKLVGAKPTKCNRCKRPIWLIQTTLGTRQFLENAELHPAGCQDKPRQVSFLTEGDPTGGDR